MNAKDTKQAIEKTLKSFDSQPLAQAGIISDDDCSTCTRRILSNFD